MSRPDSLEQFWDDQRQYWLPDANAILGLMGDGVQHVIVEAPNGTGKSKLLIANLERATYLTGRDFELALSTLDIQSTLRMSYEPTLLIVDEFSRAPLHYSAERTRREGFHDSSTVDSYLQYFIGNPNVKAVIITAASTQQGRRELGETFVQAIRRLGSEAKTATYSMERQYIPDDQVARYFELLGASQEIMDFVMEPSHRALRTPKSLARFERTRKGLFMLDIRLSNEEFRFMETHPQGVTSQEDLRDAFSQTGEFYNWRETRIGGSFPDLWKVMLDLGVVEDHLLVSSVRSLEDAVVVTKQVREDQSRVFELERELRNKRELLESVNVENSKNHNLVRGTLRGDLDLGPATRKHLLLKDGDGSLYIETSSTQDEITRLKQEVAELKKSGPAELPFSNLARAYFD